MHTAAKHGLRATFAPRTHMYSLGNSAHAHISVHSKHTVKTAEELSPPESSFLSSILTNLPALTALTMPIPASYQRMADGIWSGGTYVNWGTDNREAPIRLANASSPSSRNFEIRCVDATANPYIALASILGVGLDGIKNNVELIIQDCPGPVTAAEMTEEGRQALGITSRMSLTWEESRSNLKANKLLTEHVLGPELTEKYLSVNTVCGLVGGEDSSRLMLFP
jgi:glutamine synthetase